MKLRNKNTGIIIDLDYWHLYTFGNLIGFESDNGEEYCYNSLAKLNEEWEDYTPKEPLIKDEKIRKAVRLCADIWGADKILVTKSGSRIEFSDGSPNMRYVSFMYAGWQDEIEDRTYYAVEELCGEEEE